MLWNHIVFHIKGADIATFPDRDPFLIRVFRGKDPEKDAVVEIEIAYPGVYTLTSKKGLCTLSTESGNEAAGFALRFLIRQLCDVSFEMFKFI